MASFLRRLLGQPPSAEVAEALQALAQLSRERPSLQAPASILSELLPILFAADGASPAPPLTADVVCARAAAGVPLLRGEKLALDEAASRRRWRSLCALLARQPGGEAARALSSALRRGALEPLALLQAVLDEGPAAVHARAAALSLDATLTATVLRLTSLPLLARTAELLAPLRAGAAWERGYCATCGSWPLLGEFRGLQQQRVLRCGLCASAWEFARLRCPYCDERDHRRLGYFHVADEGDRYRAATCDACKGYVKMTSTLAPLSAPLLLVADAATLHLDLAAADRGYAAPSGAAIA